MQKKFSFFLVIVMLFACLMTACGPDDSTGGSLDFSDESFRYVFYEDGWGIAAVEGYAPATLTIPAEVKGSPVVRIERNGFANNASLTSVTIPNSVKEIGEGAFAGCTALATIPLSDNVVLIGNEAFANTAFYNDAANWENDVLYNGKYLIDAKITITGEYEIKDGTLAIACHAFVDRDDNFGYIGSTGLTKVVFPDGLKSIGNGAFQNCTALAELEIPESVTYFGDYAFQNTKYFNEMLNDDEDTTDVYYIGKHLVVADAADLSESYTVEAGTLTIASPAFANCDKLETVEIPASVTRIGIGAFRNCSALTSIVFDGTEEEWGKITKGYAWDQNTGDYKITFKKGATEATK